MKEWIVVLSLAVALAALAAAGSVYGCCRKMRREKNRSIARALHEQDLLARELDRIRIEKQTIERVLTTTLSAVAEKPAAQRPGGKEDDP